MLFTVEVAWSQCNDRDQRRRQESPAYNFQLAILYLVQQHHIYLERGVKVLMGVLESYTLTSYSS